MYDMKALYEASSVENAVALRLEHPEAQIIAGGSDVERIDGLVGEMASGVQRNPDALHYSGKFKLPFF